MNVKGIVKVELFDDKTGKKIYENEGENYISKLGKEAMRRVQMMLVGGNTAGYNTSCNFAIPRQGRYSIHMHSDVLTLTRYLHLTNDSQIEDENEMKVTQPTLAWVDLTTPYADSAANRGNINEVESTPGLNSVKWVCDYNTNQANGTFHSIYTSEFSSHLDSTTGRLEFERVGVFKEFGGGGLFRKATSDLNNIYAISSVAGSSGLWKIDKISKEAEMIGYFTPFNDWQIDNIIHFDGYIYALKTWEHKIARFNLSTSEWQEISMPTIVARPRLMCTDGVNIYLFATNASNASSLAKINHSTFEIEDEGYTATNIGSGYINMFYLNNYIYVAPSATTGTVYEIDFSTKSVLNVTSTMPQLRQRDIFIRGQGHNGEVIVAQVNYEKTSTIYTMGITQNIQDQNCTFFSRRRLQEPVTKTDTQAMKITYTFIFV